MYKLRSTNDNSSQTLSEEHIALFIPLHVLYIPHNLVCEICHTFVSLRNVL